MSRGKLYLTTFFILILAFFAWNLVYPQFLNLKIIPDIPFRLGLDLRGGTHLVYQADLSKIDREDHHSSMQGLRDVIERRVNLFGVQEPIVQTQERGGQHRLIVELAGVKEPAEAIKMIGETPFLEFREQREEEETQRILAKQEEIREIIGEEVGETGEETDVSSLPLADARLGEETDVSSLPLADTRLGEETDVSSLPLADARLGEEDFLKIQAIENWQLAFEDPFFSPTILTGKYLRRAELGFDQTGFTPLVLLEFNEEGAKIFEELTKNNLGKILAIYIDNALISAPTVQSVIAGGRAQITGDFTVEAARELARNLNAGALPVPIALISQQTVGPTLGAVSLEQSLKAGMLGFLAIVIFMIIFYKIPGLVSSLDLLIYIALVLSVFKLVPVTLTLAGIGGFILSIGMAVDANILIFSRMREELKEGKNLGLSIENGFSRAWSSVRDGNLTTLIVAVILFAFGTSFIKGFALTLSLGIIISMLSVFIISKNFLRCFAQTRLEKVKWLW